MGEHCKTCICGKRAPVQAARSLTKGPGSGPGTIDWAEHELAWSNYARQYGRDQTAQRMADRGGFCYAELTDYLGYPPKTWAPAGSVAERERR